MILQALIGKLQTDPPNATWSVVGGDTPKIVFPPIHEPFGEIEVLEEDDELTVNFGRFTHAHFSCYDDDLSLAEKADLIAANVLTCLVDTFSDQIEFYGSHSSIGGFRPRGSQGLVSKLALGSSAYVWSGADG